MDFGDLISSFITLFFLLVVIVGPMLIRFIGSPSKDEKKEKSPDEENFFRSVDTHEVVRRMRAPDLNETGEMLEDEENMAGLEEQERVTPAPVVTTTPMVNSEKTSSELRISRLSEMKRAVLWSEILSKPVALKRE